MTEKTICRMYILADPEDRDQTKLHLEGKLSQLQALLAALSSGFLELNGNELANTFWACSSLADECVDLFHSIEHV